MLSPAADQSASARRAMIDSQLRTSGVNEDFVLRRMAAVPREDFVPEAARNLAYVDRAIRLPEGGWLAAPLVQGMMLQEAAPRADDVAIVIDGGAGYLAELLRPLVAQVVVLTPQEALGAGRKGKDATLLLIEGAVEEVPARLATRLADGARIVTGMVDGHVTRLATGRKTASGPALVPVHDIGIPRLAAFDRPPAWSF